MEKSKTIVYTIANQKGGVGKTTLTLNLGISLSRMGKRVCIIDCDPQANLTTVLGYNQPIKIAVALPHLMMDLINLDFEIEKSELLQNRQYILHVNNMDLIASNIKLTGVDNMLVTQEIGRETVIKKIVNYIKDDYDYVLLDTTPSLNIITINALNAANSVIIPMQPQFFSVKGLELFLATFKRVKDNLNPYLEIAGVLITMYDNRLTLHKEMTDAISETFKGLRIFNTKIPVSVRVAESQAKAQSIFDYDPNGKVAESYTEFTKELINK